MWRAVVFALLDWLIVGLTTVVMVFATDASPAEASIFLVLLFIGLKLERS